MICTREHGLNVIAIEPTDDRETIFQCLNEQREPVVLVLPDKICPFAIQQDYTRLKETNTNASARPVIIVSGSEQLRKLACQAGLTSYSTLNGFFQLLKEDPSLIAAHPDASHLIESTQMSEQNHLVQGMPLTQQESRVPGYTPPFAPPPGRRKNVLGGSMVAVLLLLLLLSVGLNVYQFSLRPSSPSSSPAAVPMTVGNVYFLSSEQVTTTSNQGLNDEILVDLHGLSEPTAGLGYYAWLLPDAQSGDASAIALGSLSIHNGSAHLMFAGTPQHQNLLGVTSRFLVTEEDVTRPPIAPSTDKSTWRYYAAIPQVVSKATESGARGFSLLDHLRHLLVDDPTLKEMDLPGGLNAWLYQNTAKILEWGLSARDYDGTDPQFVRRQIIRILAYLDGLTFVQQDIPPATVIPLTTRFVRMGLIDMEPNQISPSLLSHIVFHLNGLLSSVGATSEQRTRAAAIITAMSNVNAWLSTMRTETRQLMALPDAQLLSARAHSLFNDVVLLARAANDGQVSPDSGQIQEGVVWISLNLQSLATLTVSPFPG